MMRTTDYDSMDKAALESALLSLHQCPRCHCDLRPVALAEDVWGFDGKQWPEHSPETWHLRDGN